MSSEKKVLDALWAQRDFLMDESSQRADIPSHQALQGLVKDIVQNAQINHVGDMTTPDIIHWRWATILRDMLYLGSITQQKAVRPDCSGYDLLRDLIRATSLEAFDMGVRDAPDRERRTHKNPSN